MKYMRCPVCTYTVDDDTFERRLEEVNLLNLIFPDQDLTYDTLRKINLFTYVCARCSHVMLFRHQPRGPMPLSSWMDPDEDDDIATYNHMMGLPLDAPTTAENMP